jgi:3-oxoacyl-[acyl-carrier protein] reductase
MGDEERMINEEALAGRVALVTGAGRGIGRAIALELARASSSVALVARTEPELQAVERDITTAGGRATSHVADVSQEEQVIEMMRGVAGRYGRLDILVNNAGVGVFGPLESTSAADWDRVMAVNARGTFLCCRQAITYLREQPISHIVNVSSVVGHKGYANQAAYSASKHAIMGMTKALAKEVQADGIRVHALCPGGVDTGMVGDARPDLDRSVLMTSEEVAEVVLFLVTRRGNAVIDRIDLRRATSTPFA